MIHSNSRGILQPETARTQFTLHRYPPAPELAAWIEHYWLIHWDLRGQPPYHQTTLPYPCVHLTLERESTPHGAHQHAVLTGVVTGKFTRCLAGAGAVVGVKFRPGGFYPFAGVPIADLTDRVIPLHQFFGEAAAALLTAAFECREDAERVALMERFLLARLPKPDANIALIDDLVARIFADRALLKVDDLARQVGIGKRTLQRLFRQYVGVSPKWVIQRYRLHDAAERLASDPTLDWPRLAQELGYFDQAHFIKDFKALVGMTPADYARTCRQ